MKLNDISATVGSRPDAKRVGRGQGSGLGKTCGRGHKGQKSRAGGFHKVGFEGGQMPLQRRLPKVGFRSRKSLVTEEIRLSELKKCKSSTITLAELKAANLVGQSTRHAKIILSGKIDAPYTITGLGVTAGARAAIESAGGSVSE